MRINPKKKIHIENYFDASRFGIYFYPLFYSSHFISSRLPLRMISKKLMTLSDCPHSPSIELILNCESQDGTHSPHLYKLLCSSTICASLVFSKVYIFPFLLGSKASQRWKDRLCKQLQINAPQGFLTNLTCMSSIKRIKTRNYKSDMYPDYL